jgi:hypothetical protein
MVVFECGDHRLGGNVRLVFGFFGRVAVSREPFESGHASHVRAVFFAEFDKDSVGEGLHQ